MVLPSPAKNALFDLLFGMGLNSDILTVFCCISRISFVRGRALPYYKNAWRQGWAPSDQAAQLCTKLAQEQRKKQQKKIDFCLFI